MKNQNRWYPCRDYPHYAWRMVRVCRKSAEKARRNGQHKEAAEFYSGAAGALEVCRSMTSKGMTKFTFKKDCGEDVVYTTYYMTGKKHEYTDTGCPWYI